MTIKGVVFDFGGVILSFENIKPFWDAYDKQAGLPIGTIAAEVKGTGFTEWTGKGGIFTGEISVEEVENGLFSQYINEKYNTNLPLKMTVLSSCLANPDHVVFSKKIHLLIKQLHGKGLKSALLTNNCYLDIEHKEARLPYDTSVFDVVVESCIEGVMKPDQKIYKIMSDRLGLEPNELVFLDDLKENCEAAVALGWQAIQVDLSKEDEAVEKLESLLNVKFDF
ncbi:unnamed protein product [Auanema sp. JU1783]|nr:unnamed protein product [Auanema sp. JU1783]